VRYTLFSIKEGKNIARAYETATYLTRSDVKQTIGGVM